MKVTLYYYEYCNDSIGTWSREWALDEEDIVAKRERKAEYYGTDVADESELTGEYGEIGAVEQTEVELSATGLVDFANNWAAGGE